METAGRKRKREEEEEEEEEASQESTTGPKRSKGNILNSPWSYLTEHDADTQTSQPSTKITSQDPKKRLQQYSVASRKHEAHLISTLSAALDWLPEGGRDALAVDILGAKDDAALHDVFKNFVTNVILAIKSVNSTSKAPAIMDQPCGKRKRSIDAVYERTYRSSFSSACFERDDFQCVVTDLSRDRPVRLRAHRIVPFSLVAFSDEDETEVRKKWAAVYRYFPAIQELARGPKIDKLEDAFTLHSAVVREFQRFRCALKPTETPHVYTFKQYWHFDGVLINRFAAQDKRIVLQARGDTEKKLPSKILLDCHYRLAEIYNSSGIAEFGYGLGR